MQGFSGSIPRAFINRKLFLFLVAVFSFVFFAGFIAYDTVLRPRANPADEKYLYLDSSWFFQRKYHQQNIAPDVYLWVSQAVPSSGISIPEGQYVLSTRARVVRSMRDAQDPFDLQILLELEEVALQPADPTRSESVLGESIAQFSLPGPGGGKNPSPAKRQIKIEYSGPSSSLTVKSKQFTLNSRMKGRIFIKTLKGSAAVVDYVSLVGPDGKEILVNHSFNNSPMTTVNYKGFSGWGAGNGSWGYNFIFPAKVRSFFSLAGGTISGGPLAGGGPSSAGKTEDFDGFVVNSLDVPPLSRVYTRLEKIFQAGKQNLSLEIRAFSPFVQKRGAFAWIACAGVKNKSVGNTPRCSGYNEPGGANVGKCFFINPVNNTRCYVNENQALVSIRFDKANNLKVYKKTVTLPGRPEDNGPFWIRFAALDGSELFVDRVKITTSDKLAVVEGGGTAPRSATAETVMLVDDFQYQSLANIPLQKRIPFGWSFGENRYQGRGFNPGLFVFVYTGQELGLGGNPTPTPTRRPTNTPTPTRRPTNTPTPRPTAVIATSTPTPTRAAGGGGIGPTVILTLTPIPTTDDGRPTVTETLTRPTNTPTPTRRPTNTPTPTRKPTNTPTPTRRPTNTPVPTRRPTNTPTPTRVPAATNTPTPIPTSTPTPVLTPVATSTPTPTPTPVKVATIPPTPTQAPVTPTPTPVISPTPTQAPVVTLTPTVAPTDESVRLKIALRLQGIRSLPKGQVRQLPILISLRKFGEEKFIHKAGIFEVNQQGIWIGEVEFTSADGFSSGDYLVYVKGPMHMQKKICDLVARENFPGSYSCAAGRSLPLQSGQVNIDLSRITLLAGDLPDQDGLVNAYDIALVRNLLGKTDPESLAKADVNLDGIVDITDFVLIQAALSVRYDEGEFDWNF